MTREEALQAIKAKMDYYESDKRLRGALETLIPELRESEDERIRKFLIQHISEWIGCIEHDLKHSLKDIESEKELAMFKAGLAWLERQKEQKPDAKSERVIKAARRVLNIWLDGTDCPDVSGDFTELEYAIREYDGDEKQKEQNGEDGFLEDELSAFLQNYDKEYDDDAAVSDVARHFYEIGKKQNEQKPHTDEEKEYVRTIKSIISDFIRDKKPENLAYYQRIYDWLDGRYVPFSCGHENDKSAWSEEDEK